ncbi:MAG: cyclic 2,3-diphosphoglycerate synthase [Candidatus Eremiobacterota bacterium]
MVMKKIKVLIMGAAGRDFHNFNVYFRNNASYDVIAFTAAQIPNIDDRKYPPVLAGSLYPEGIPIYPEEDMEKLVKEHQIDQVIFSYSDIAHKELMHKASIVLASGADFRLMGPCHTMIKASVPIISVCAVRTGVGKSQTTRKVCKVLKGLGYRVVAIRHPMPYGDLSKQIWQRFATLDDLDKYECTIEEREEYAPHIEEGIIVYAGVDYGKILEEARKEADVIIWDGGNNDFSFYKPDFSIVLVDPHRPGNELSYYPGEVNLRSADLVIINKVDTAKEENVLLVRKNIEKANPSARIMEGFSPITVDDYKNLKHDRVLVVEDGPTLTHGNMTYGAAFIAARDILKAKEIVDPRPCAEGSIKEVYSHYSHLDRILPAMGYGKEQMKELEDTINKTECDLVLLGTPVDLRRFLNINKHAVRIKYELVEKGKPDLLEILKEFMESKKV